MRLPVVDQVFGSNKAPIDVVLTADFADLAKEAADMAERANGLPRSVKSDADLALVGIVITDARELAKRIESTRLEEGRPLLDAQRSINEHFKALAAKIADAIAPAQKAADTYTRAKVEAEKARRAKEAEEARRREEAARAKAEQATSAAAAARATQEAERQAIKAETAERTASSSNADLARTRAGGVTASAKGSWTYRLLDYDAVEATLGKLGPFIKREAVLDAIASIGRIKKGAVSLPGVEFFRDTKATFRK